MDYFKLLCDINSVYDPKTPNIRYNRDKLKIIINRLDKLNYEEFNLDEFLKLCTCIFNMQIFYDANSITVLEFIKVVLENYNLILDLEKIKLDFPSY